MSVALLLTAASVGIIHTLLGPDHYLPFIMISKARNWGMKKTAAITFLCGLGHILVAVLLGFLGYWFGINVLHLEAIDGVRGNLAAWGLIAFGLVYFVWGLKRAYSAQNQNADKKNITAWVLFIILALGPCEPLIPILLYPAAASGGLLHMGLVALVFGAATIATMMFVVLNACYGLSFVNLKPLNRWGHALAGFTILACGLSVQFLGL